MIVGHSKLPTAIGIFAESLGKIQFYNVQILTWKLFRQTCSKLKLWQDFQIEIQTWHKFLIEFMLLWCHQLMNQKARPKWEIGSNLGRQKNINFYNLGLF